MKIVVTVTILGAVALLPAVARADFEPNDNFATRAILDPSVRTVSDSITASVAGEGPDTTMGAFNQYGGLIEYNDDGSSLGDGTASSLVLVGINSDGSIHLRVSGFADFDFDGLDDYWDTPHEQAGDYDLFLHVLNSSYQQVDYLEYNETLATGAVDSFDLSGYDPGGAFLAYIDNTPSIDEDPMDFMTFTGLPAGGTFEAEITSAGFDTMLGWFDNDGVLIESDDDAGDGELLSMITGEVPGDGLLNLAVTGYPDLWFEGFHGQEGDYTLEVRIIPDVIPGDTQPDGQVDGADYTVWADNYLASPVPPWSEGGWSVGNFNEDNTVDGADYTIWADNYGETAGGKSLPEPGGIALLALGAAALRRRRAGPKAPRG